MRDLSTQKLRHTSAARWRIQFTGVILATCVSVSFATPDVAVATVISNMTAFTMPNGIRHPNDRQIRTFVVVKRSDKWLVMLDQNTIVNR